MRVEVRLFAILRERAGRDSLEIELPENATVADALAAARLAEGLRGTIERLPLVMAVNREYADESTPLEAGDELALIPPVSGGAVAARRPSHVRITGEPLSLEAVSGHVRHPAAGAVVTFQGTTRDVPSLHYEAYEEMASARIAEILAAATERHDLAAAAAEHRVGKVPLGEPSVIVACSAVHRGEAFAGAREAIDRIKAEVPIWKKEIEGDGGRWVEGKSPRRPGQ